MSSMLAFPATIWKATGEMGWASVYDVRAGRGFIETVWCNIGSSGRLDKRADNVMKF